MPSKQQTVLLGVTGSIAAYKACELLRLLQQAGLRVKVVMTKSAQEFVGAATFKALSQEPVAVDLFDQPNTPVHHISLAKQADAYVVAPCTANVLNKIASGVADDLLTTTALATKAPLLLAPAANPDMLDNQVTVDALATLRARGVQIIEPGSGYLACGDQGSGRLAEVEDIAQEVLQALKRSTSLSGKKVLITAGPTREYLDPVRYISSPSSGLTGFALAREAERRGAEVVLIYGPVELPAPVDVQTIKVVSAQQMLDAAGQYFQKSDIAIFSAAVSDFRPTVQAGHKLKKGLELPGRSFAGATQSCLADAGAAVDDGDNSGGGGATDDGQVYSLELTSNPDILATLAAQKGQTFVVGFAAETQDVIKNAQAKLASKNADLIVANDVSDPGLGFASTHNKVWLIDAHGSQETDIISKRQLAALILDTISAKLC